MGWSFPWASSRGGDFNFDFNVSFTEEQQRHGGIEYNYERGGQVRCDAGQGLQRLSPVRGLVRTAGDLHAQRPGMSAFALEDGGVYHTYSAYARGWTALGHVQWLDLEPAKAQAVASGGPPRAPTRNGSGTKVSFDIRQEGDWTIVFFNLPGLEGASGGVRYALIAAPNGASFS